MIALLATVWVAVRGPLAVLGALCLVCTGLMLVYLARVERRHRLDIRTRPIDQNAPGPEAC